MAGWAGAQARLDVWVDGLAVGSAVANEDRPDLAAVGGRAFEFWFDPPLRPGAEIVVGDFPAAQVSAPRQCRGQPDQGRRLALFVDQAVPAAGRDAGSDAAVSHIEGLRRLGFAVAVAAHAEVPAALDEYAGRVRLAYLHRLPSMAWLPAVRAANPGVRAIYGVGDLHGLRARRRREVTGHPVPHRLEAAELATARTAHVITHSEVEAALLAASGIAARVVPWHVPLGAAAAAGGDEMLFVGSFGHAPNRDAVAWLLTSVMPTVWARAPEVRLRLAGRDMPAWVREAASERVAVEPDAPDLAQTMRRVRLALAPLRFGAGIKGKVLTAMAHALPCLCTPVAAEGLATAPVLIAECDADAYANAVIEAWSGVDQLARAGCASRAWVARHWSRQATDGALATVAFGRPKAGSSGPVPRPGP